MSALREGSKACTKVSGNPGGNTGFAVLLKNAGNSIIRALDFEHQTLAYATEQLKYSFLIFLCYLIVLNSGVIILRSDLSKVLAMISMALFYIGISCVMASVLTKMKKSEWVSCLWIVGFLLLIRVYAVSLLLPLAVLLMARRAVNRSSLGGKKD